MHIIRPIRPEDADAYVKFALAARLGMSNLPKNPELLHQNIKTSLQAFSEASNAATNHFYLFVLEDLITKEIGGTCGIYSQIGLDYPYYYYREEILHPKPYKDFLIEKNLRIMRPVKITHGPSEVCSLYLAPAFRKEGLGRLLSLSRFMFISAFPARFQETIIAEMRGYSDQNNSTPFWEHLGRHFFDIDYAKTQHLRDHDKNFIPYILPEYPIYISLLPTDAQKMIGQVHENTVPALKMLLKEGFEMTKDYDVFDAGPVLQAKTRNIRTVETATKRIIKEISTGFIDSNRYIISNNKLAFRACYSELQQDNDGLTLPAKTVEALALQRGDEVIYTLAN